jgi:hypothetical protein
LGCVTRTLRQAAAIRVAIRVKLFYVGTFDMLILQTYRLQKMQCGQVAYFKATFWRFGLIEEAVA